jgi:hypothetical protein
VAPFAYAKVLQNLHQIVGSPKATLRMAIKKGRYFSAYALVITSNIFLQLGL